MRVRNILRITVYSLLAILLFVFPDFFVRYVAFSVGIVMILFGIDELVFLLLKKESFKKHPTAVTSVIAIAGGALMMIFLSRPGDPEDLIKVCTIWAVWSISQEAFELFETYEMFRKHRLGVVSALESAFVIFLSVLLVIDPAEHVKLHLIILGAELLLKFAFPLVYGALIEKKQKKLVAKENGGKSE